MKHSVRVNSTSDVAKLFLVLGVARIALGCIFLWGFFDKLFGLGFATCRNTDTGSVQVMCGDAWLNGASPTASFLQFATDGPLKDIFQSMVGNPVVDWLFMLALLLIGLALILGIGVRIAVMSGSLFMLILWSSMLLPANNPLIDEHIIYILLLVAIYYANDQQRLGLGAWWRNQPMVRRYTFLH